jgi:hypothetical protein
MELITTLEAIIKKRHQKDWSTFLQVQKSLVEEYFDWIHLRIHTKSKSIVGRGKLNVDGELYEVILTYSPFNHHRYDRVYILGKDIAYNKKIHVYADLSLCLYHPIIDKPIFQFIPLFQIIPWITEWIIFYNLWKKYGVWLTKEIKH